MRTVFFIYFHNNNYGLKDVTSSFLLGLRFDLRDVSILCLFLLISGSIPFLNPFNEKAGKILFRIIVVIAAFLLAFFYSVDFAHYSYLSQRLNASVLNYLGDAAISTKMVWQSYPVLKILILLGVMTWGVSWLINRKLKKIAISTQLSAKRSRVIWFVVCFLVFGFCIFGKADQFPLRWSDAFALGNDYKANLALNPFQSFFSTLKFRRDTYDIAKVKKGFSLLAPYYSFNERDSSRLNFKRNVLPRAGAIKTTPNVVLVICESFSAYKSSMWGNPLNTTPFFNEMTKNGIFFDHCFTPTYGTARGVWAVITGIPDVEIGTTTSSRNPSAVNQHTIINDFTNYSKYYFIGGSTSWANIRGLLTNNISGLNLFEEKDFSSPKIDVWGISDKNLFLEANKKLKEEKKPFIAVIQTADNHRPYSIPQEDLTVFHKIEMPKDSLKLYGFESNDEMNAFRYTDFGFKTFIEAARKEKYFNNTVFLFIGDHGIVGNAGNMFPHSWTEQKLTMEHVPLLIYSPALIGPRRIHELCSQVDVLPTLAGLCNMPYQNTTLGRDILDTVNYKNKAFSFIYNPDEEYIGLIKGNYFYKKQVKGGKEEMVSVIDNQPVPADVRDGETKVMMKTVTYALYEVSKYMILNNKK
ncbi:MAG TPA: sulfatase-like hydrolase/transferase [Puia sp.]|nr:sulfatase-like hydrolase/transferase [Puia sp.]